MKTTLEELNGWMSAVCALRAFLGIASFSG